MNASQKIGLLCYAFMLSLLALALAWRQWWMAGLHASLIVNMARLARASNREEQP